MTEYAIASVAAISIVCFLAYWFGVGKKPKP